MIPGSHPSDPEIMKLESNRMTRYIPTGNDESDDDATTEKRMDKDADFKDDAEEDGDTEHGNEVEPTNNDV